MGTAQLLAVPRVSLCSGTMIDLSLSSLFSGKRLIPPLVSWAFYVFVRVDRWLRVRLHIGRDPALESRLPRRTVER